MASSSEEDKVEYIHQALLRPSTQNDEDNKSQDSNLLFMSEPSMSEADSTEHRMRLLSPFDDGDDDGDDDYGLPPPPPPPAQLQQQHQQRYLATQSNTTTSPGNTSLSSWESPHLNARRIQLHFSPEPNLNNPNNYPPQRTNYRVDPYGRLVMPALPVPPVPQTPNLLLQHQPQPYSYPQQQPYPYPPQQQQPQQQQQLPQPPNSTETTSRRSSVTSSVSAVSDGQRHCLEEFLTDLRVNSQGQVQESTTPGGDASLESGSRRGGDPPDMNGILRRAVPVQGQGQGPSPLTNQQSRITSVDTQVTDNVSTTSRAGVPADDTVVMTLSASEDEKESTASNTNNNISNNNDDDSNNDSNNNTRPRLDSEQQHSADDEKTAGRPARTRIRTQRGEGGHRRQKSGEMGHRRQRSGDAAAAILLTGSKDWKGMSQDQIPLPEGNDDDDDDDDNNNNNNLPPPVEKQREKKEHDKYNNKLSALEGGFGSKNFQNNANASANTNTNTNVRHHKSMNAAQFSQFAIGTGGNVGPQGEPRYIRRSFRRDGSKFRTSRGAFTEQEFAAMAAAHNHFATTSSLGSYSDQSASKLQQPQQQQPQQQQQHQQQVPPEMLGPQSQFIPSVQEQCSHSANASQRKRPISRSTPPMGASPPVASPRSQFMASVQSQWSPQPPTLPEYSPQISHSTGSFGSGRATFANHRSKSERVVASQEHHQWGQNSLSSIESSFSWLSQHHPPPINTELNYRSGTTQPEISPLYVTRNEEQAGEQSTEQDESLQLETDTTSSSSSDKHANIKNLLNAIQGNTGGMDNPTRVVRHSFLSSPFANIGKSAGKADRRRFMPQTSTVGQDDRVYPTYSCPLCKTQQREFFTVSSAPHQFESASGYIALYFGIYVVAALYIFGLQEGWPALDCIYFAVITLTTAGLGDLVPTSDGAKIICSIFIYFGVACIGLLLGSYIAGMLDETSSREAKANRIKSCPNCARLQTIKDNAERRSNNQPFGGVPQQFGRRTSQGSQPPRAAYHLSRRPDIVDHGLLERDSKKVKRQHAHAKPTGFMAQSERIPQLHTPFSSNSAGLVSVEMSPANSRSNGSADTPAGNGGSNASTNSESPVIQTSPANPYQSKHVLGSPMTAQILGRQSHTRHTSLDLNSGAFSGSFAAAAARDNRGRNFSVDLPATMEENVEGNETDGAAPPPPPSWQDQDGTDDSDDQDEGTMSDLAESTSSSSSSDDSMLEEQFSSVKNAKYVFLTLKEALVNSMVIIAFGCMGFYYIEGFTIVDSWYFTTVLLTTVGYGDIVPVTKGGKLFATVYILVAGTILLNNMSMISMIPLELRKRRIEHSVLTQFGDELDDAALRELATGPLIQRLKLASKNTGGLDECTREMFALAMLVRLGKVTEHDIRQTFAAFQKLDVQNDGVLNSKSIIAGMIQKRRRMQLGPDGQQHGSGATPTNAAAGGGGYWPQWSHSQPAPGQTTHEMPTFHFGGAATPSNGTYQNDGISPHEQSSLISGASTYQSFDFDPQHMPVQNQQRFDSRSH